MTKNITGAQRLRAIKQTAVIGQFNIEDLDALERKADYINRCINSIGIHGKIRLDTTTDILKWRALIKFSLEAFDELTLIEIETLTNPPSLLSIL